MMLCSFLPVRGSIAPLSELWRGWLMNRRRQGALSLGALCRGTRTVHLSRVLGHTDITKD